MSTGNNLVIQMELAVIITRKIHFIKLFLKCAAKVKTKREQVKTPFLDAYLPCDILRTSLKNR
jgi:hypothetical protein